MYILYRDIHYSVVYTVYMCILWNAYIHSMSTPIENQTD